MTLLVVLIIVVERLDVRIKPGISEFGRAAEECADVQALPGGVATLLLAVANRGARFIGVTCRGSVGIDRLER